MSGASTGGAERARPFGVIACDDAVDYHRAARHLVAVGVPAVIGLFKAEEAIDLTTSVFLPRRILAVASLSTNPLVTRVPHPPGVPRLVWRTTYISADAASAISTWIAGGLEPALRTANRELAHRGLRIALVRPRSAAGDALGEAFLKKLRFNGTTALDSGASYRELTIEAEAPRSSPEYARIERELLAFAPDIVIYAASVAIVDALFAPLEAHWPASAPYRPRYISVASLSKELLEFTAADRDRRGRFFGITPVSSTSANVRFVTHYNDAFPGDPITRTINPNSSYDAFYLLAYASYAIPDREAVTGDRLAQAFGRLVPPGTPIEAGIADIFAAYAVLHKDASIDFTGATGKLDFDLATGESAFDQAILCVGVGLAGKLDGVESGLVYVARTQRLEGTARCP
jgi:branched-chain amino acid transport system substrate-binding protein